MPTQNRHEWEAYLEFIGCHFRRHALLSPVVVELGVCRGESRQFYRTLFNARYIGIDVDGRGNPEIPGNTHDKAVQDKLKKMLDGNPIGLLFIDACHCYHDVKADYEGYSPLVNKENGIIAFHDIYTDHPGVRVKKFWDEIEACDDSMLRVTFRHKNTYPAWDYGIGLLIHA